MILIALILFAGSELWGPRSVAPPVVPPSPSAQSRPAQSRPAQSRPALSQSRQSGPGSGPVHDSTTSAVSRLDVYRAMRSSEDIRKVEELVRSLEEALGSETLRLVDADFRTAMENDDPEVIAACAFILTKLAQETGDSASSVDDALIHEWIDYFALSDAAAAGISSILQLSGRIEATHFEAVLTTWRSGLPPGRAIQFALGLLLNYAEVHRDPEPYLPLLEDTDVRLQQVAITALSLIDPARFLPLILDLASQRTAAERSEMLATLVQSIPRELASKVLLEWHERWPETSLTGAWTEVGFHDGDSLIFAYRAATDDPTIRRQILIGWSPQSLDPQAAEQFLTEVFDTDPDPRVRAQTLLALGQIDNDRARSRLEEAMGRDPESDPVFDMHLAGGVRNALSFAPPDWVDRCALPLAKRRILGATDRERAPETDRWRRALAGRFPERAQQLLEEVAR